MNAVGIVCIVFGFIVAVSRGLLLVAPAATLRKFRTLISTTGGTRTLGVFALIIAAAMTWAGASQESGLAYFLLLLGIFTFVACLPALVLFPRAFMALCDGLFPDASRTDLFGWRVIGLLGLVIGSAVVIIGIDAL